MYGWPMGASGIAKGEEAAMLARERAAATMKDFMLKTVFAV